MDRAQGAEEADGIDGLTRWCVSKSAKVQTGSRCMLDYRWAQEVAAHATFTLDELKLAVEVAGSAGIPVAAHATSTEGARRAILAGVETIEHGDGLTPELFRLMKQHNTGPVSNVVRRGCERRAIRNWFSNRALEAGVTIASGSDVGVFAHGDNAREIEAMVNWGMPIIDALRSATSSMRACCTWEDKIGQVKTGLFADLIAGRRRANARRLGFAASAFCNERRRGLPK